MHPAIRKRRTRGVGTLIRVGFPQGQLCRQPADAAAGTRPAADTDCSGNGFGDTLAHRVMIQAPQPRLRRGSEAQGQPSAGMARAKPATVDTNLGTLDRRLIQQPVAAHRDVLSLISYQAFRLTH
jgi:hypothetical protein